MGKAQTKTELLQAANDKFQQLQEKINSLSVAEQEQDFTYNAAELALKDKAQHWQRDHNLRDMLTHLFEWHQLIITWINSNEKGHSVPFLPTPYTWTTYQQMNTGFYQKHQNTSFQDSLAMVKESHKEVVKLMEKYTDSELFTKKYFPWTGSTSLGQYFHSATVAHYEWALKKVNLYIKSLKNASGAHRG